MELDITLPKDIAEQMLTFFTKKGETLLSFWLKKSIDEHTEFQRAVDPEDEMEIVHLPYEIALKMNDYFAKNGETRFAWWMMKAAEKAYDDM